MAKANLKQSNGNSDNGSEKGSSQSASMELTKTLDLSEHDYPFTIKVPDNVEFIAEKYSDIIGDHNAVKEEVLAQNPDLEGTKLKIEIARNSNFAMEVTDYGTTIEERKETWKKNDVNVVKEWVKETENGFITKNEVMNQEAYYFFYTISVNGQKYEFENYKGSQFNKAQIEAMFKACESITPK